MSLTGSVGFGEDGDSFGRKGETEAQQDRQGVRTAPWFPPVARAPGGERGMVITFRPLMSRPELAGPLGLPGEGGARAHRGEKWGEAAWWLLGQGW